MTTSSYPWFGFEVSNYRTDDIGRIGVVISGQKLLDRQYAVAQRIADAGPNGLSVDAVNRTDVDMLRSAGVKITSDPFGMRWHLAKVPAPDKFIVKVADKSTAAKPWGQFGSSGVPKKH